MPKKDCFGNKSQKLTRSPYLRRLGPSLPVPRSGKMTRECARPYTHWNYWLMQMIGNFGAKRNLYFMYFALSPLLINVPTGLGKWRHARGSAGLGSTNTNYTQPF